MRRLIGMLVVGALGLMLGLADPAAADDEKCPSDSAAVGPACIDMYEASVWEVPPANTSLIKKIRRGKATLADLTSPAAVAGGAVQHGAASDDYGAGCPDTGNGCVNFYAVSIPGVTPSAFITWLQAAAAARNSGKRLPTNQEWQAAALGTPDGAPCIVSAAGPGLTGTAGCISDVGAFDMVGNLWEWVAEWVPLSTECPGWGGFSNDLMCLAGASTTGGPGALMRGGYFNSGSFAGVLAVIGGGAPSFSDLTVGFRAAR
jgi:hypothetical protein